MNSESNEKDLDGAIESEAVSQERSRVPSGRREMLEKFGKFAVYATPFTVLAFAKKADAATGTGPGKHAVPKK